MDIDEQEAARAKEARAEMLHVMGSASTMGATPTEATTPAPTESTQAEEDEAQRRSKWQKPAAKGGKGGSQDGWYQGGWGGSSKRQWENSQKADRGDQAAQLDRPTQDLMKNMVRVVLRHEAEIQRLKQDIGYMVFIDTSGLGCLPQLRQVADSWSEQFSQGKVKSPLRLMLFMAMMELLRTQAEETLADAEKLQRCMNVGWTVEGENALSPAWVYHAWDPAAKKQITADAAPLKHVEALKQIDLLLLHAPREGVLKNFKTAKKMSPKDQYTAEVLPFMVSIGLRGESSQICYNALRLLSGLAVTKLIGVRVRPERGQESQLVKQLKESYMGTAYCDWTRPSAPWNSDA